MNIASFLWKHFGSFSRALAAFPQKTVLITIDDAYRSIYERAFPVLKEFDYPFTVFADAKRLYSNAPGALTWAMLEEMRAWGATIANHSYNHPRIGRPQKGIRARGLRSLGAAGPEQSAGAGRPRNGE